MPFIKDLIHLGTPHRLQEKWNQYQQEHQQDQTQVSGTEGHTSGSGGKTEIATAAGGSTGGTKSSIGDIISSIF